MKNKAQASLDRLYSLRKGIKNDYPFVERKKKDKFSDNYGILSLIKKDKQNIQNLIDKAERLNNKSLFITLEGCEGAGKSTVAKLLKVHYEAKGMNVVLTREPGGCKKAEDIRTQIMNEPNLTVEDEIKLFAKARKYHCDEVIKPALSQENTIVICDRYIHSNYAYQGYLNDYGKSNTNYLNMVKEVNKKQKVIMPDLVFFIDVNPKVGLQRINEANRHTNRFDKLDLVKHYAIYNAFQRMSVETPNDVVRVNGEQEPSKIVKEIINLIDN